MRLKNKKHLKNKQNMKKLFILMLLFCSCAIGANAQLLYKITGKNLKRPSYIIATYHFCPASFADSIRGLKEALQSTDIVYGELVNDSMMAPSRLQELQRALMMPEGKTFSSLFTADEMARINVFLKAHIGADFTNPMVAQQLDKLNPTTLSTQIMAAICMQKQGGKVDITNAIDGYFQNWAKQNGKKVGGLETIDFQMKMLFKKPLARQAQDFICLVDNEDFNIKCIDMVLKGYFEQNLTDIQKALDLKLNNSCDDTPEEKADLIDNRNADWVTKMPTIMESQPTFFAVGAAHLVGEKGVLNLLRKAGYQVEGVK
jgi:uncharacterized protein YbaP (TraB family)